VEGDKGTGRKEEKNNLGSNSLSVSGRDSENNVTAVYTKHPLKTSLRLKR